MIYLPRRDREQEKAESLEILERNARIAGIDLNAASEQMFRTSPDCLNETERCELLLLLCKAAREVTEKKHKHFCVECGRPISCDVEGCTETEGYDHCADELESRSNRWLHRRSEVMR
jgi:hypothetical protein